MARLVSDETTKFSSAQSLFSMSWTQLAVGSSDEHSAILCVNSKLKVVQLCGRETVYQSPSDELPLATGLSSCTHCGCSLQSK